MKEPKRSSRQVTNKWLEVLEPKIFGNLKLFFVFMFLILFSGNSYSQRDESRLPLMEVIENIMKVHGVQFNYQSSSLEGVKVVPLKEESSLPKKLENLQHQTSFRFSRVGSKIISVIKTTKICGFVWDKYMNAPLEGATIQAEHGYTVSNEKGYFELNNVAFNEEVEVRFVGFKPSKVVGNFFAEKSCKSLYLEEEVEVVTPVVIKGYLVNGIDKSSDGSLVIDFSRFATLPGLIEADVLQTIQALPGIQSTDETVSNINIRGGSHDQNLILWDGIKMYQSGHFFGLISSFNPQVTKRVSVVTNGTDASFTDGVSGTIQMMTDRKIQREFKGNIGVNFISADAFLDVPLGQRSSIQLAGRKSINDWLQTPTYDRYFERVTQLTEIASNEENVINSNQDFDFYDTSARWLYNISDKDKLRVNFLWVHNDLSFNETAKVTGILTTRESILNQNSLAGGINYSRQWNDDLLTELSIYETDYKLKAINANVREQQRFLQENIVSETGVKLNNFYHLNDWRLNAGYQFIETKITNLNDIDDPRFVRLKSLVTRENALFFQGDYRNETTGLSIKPGVRLSHIEKFKKTFIEPRLSIRQQFNEHFQVELLGEFKHQNTTKTVNFQNDFLGVEKRRWELADMDAVPIIKSKQISLGGAYSNRGWLVDVEGYYKDVHGITTQSQEFTTKYEFEKEEGSYHILGFDCLLRKQFKNLNTWLSYSFMKNNYRFGTLPEFEFASNFDSTHALTFGTAYTKDDLKLSLGFNYRTGKPTSVPLIGEEVSNNIVNYDDANSIRVSDYMRADASATYNVRISKGCRTEIGTSIWNLLDKKNKISNYYQINSQGIPNKFSKFSLGTTLNLMVRVHF
ncbi:CarboxypepD_reg-like domain-containing protein [Tenacibaculum sp. MAR_2009_124]|nr:CarboxypepD_reg-like domain-containing protein [Tenacibaculum sp. MAR_2009_124]